MQRKKILLAGQQNAGKSTIFNMLTGARQHVVNYPGVTVDKKTGYFCNISGSYQLINLPGTYSLTSFSLEQSAVSCIETTVQALQKKVKIN